MRKTIEIPDSMFELESWAHYGGAPEYRSTFSVEFRFDNRTIKRWSWKEDEDYIYTEEGARDQAASEIAQFFTDLYEEWEKRNA